MAIVRRVTRSVSKTIRVPVRVRTGYIKSVPVRIRVVRVIATVTKR